jgi:ABC-type branched-subunit amino acid transport system ATPase component
MIGLHTKSRSGILSSALKLPGVNREERRIRSKALECLEFAGLPTMPPIRLKICPSANVVF